MPERAHAEPAPLGAAALRARALRLLSRREHSRAQLQAKLRRFADAATLAAVLDELSAQDLLSEARFVASLLRQRAQRLGTARIAEELRRAGVQPDAEQITQLRQSETERARLVWQKKFGAPPEDAREHARQMRFLLARGFTAEAAHKVITSRAEGAA